MDELDAGFLHVIQKMPSLPHPVCGYYSEIFFGEIPTRKGCKPRPPARDQKNIRNKVNTNYKNK